MDDIWEYLLNHSPKLVEKTKHKSIKQDSENQAEHKPANLKPQDKLRSPLKPKLLNSKSSTSIHLHPISSQKPVQPSFLLTSIKPVKPSTLLARSPSFKPTSKISASPLLSKTKIKPILTSQNPFNPFKTSRK